MGWTALITIVSGLIGLAVVIYRWKMFPNKIRKEEDVEQSENSDAIRDAVDKRDIKTLNEINRKNQT